MTNHFTQEEVTAIAKSVTRDGGYLDTLDLCNAAVDAKLAKAGEQTDAPIFATHPQASEPVFPPLPHSVLRCGQTVVYDALQMHQYAMRFAATGERHE